MADNKVLIVGTMAFDEVETPTGSSGKIIAGSATYIALATSFFDLESAIVSIVGRDLSLIHIPSPRDMRRSRMPSSA